MPCRTYLSPQRRKGSVKSWEQSRFPTWICAAVVAPPRRRRPTSGQCRSSQPLLQSTLFLHASSTVVLASALLRLVKERGRRTANFSERSGTEARGGREFSFLFPPPSSFLSWEESHRLQLSRNTLDVFCTGGFLSFLFFLCK